MIASNQDEGSLQFRVQDRPLGMGELLVEGEFGQTPIAGNGDPQDIITNPDVQWQQQAMATPPAVINPKQPALPPDAIFGGNREQSGKIIGEPDKYAGNRLGYRK
jgi:hypothetical protein